MLDADIITRQGGFMDRTGHSNPQYIRINPKKSGAEESTNLSLQR